MSAGRRLKRLLISRVPTTPRKRWPVSSSSSQGRARIPRQHACAHSSRIRRRTGSLPDCAVREHSSATSGSLEYCGNILICRIRSPHQGTLCLFCKSDKSLFTYSVRCPSPLAVLRTNRQNKAPLPLIVDVFSMNINAHCITLDRSHVFSLIFILSAFFNTNSVMFIGLLEFLRV